MDIEALLFDLDGVIIDTEPQYDVFWKRTAEKYNLGIPRFEKVVKGTTLPNIISKHFSHLSREEQKQIEADNHQFDLQMTILPVPGVMEFLEESKKRNIPIGLVTSSDNKKLEYIFTQLPIKQYFNTIVSADRITEGKPHPMCYNLAAKDLNANPQQCLVFEDSFNGIRAGKGAGMKVIGLSTSNPKESIEKECWKVIPDFRSFSTDELE